MTHDLNKPLGQNTETAGISRRIRLGPWLLGSIVAVYVGLGIWIALVDNPIGGQPIVIAQINRDLAPEKPSAVAQDSPSPASNMLTATNPGDGGGPLIIKIPPSNSAAGTVSPAEQEASSIEIETDLVEKSPDGMLPKVASDGRRAADVYARPSFTGNDPRPKIAILIGGLGIGAKATENAIRHLPADITLGFAPYGKDLESWASKARQDGHEIILQVPMEPFDYPNNDPGPQTLLTQLTPDSNIQRLNWIMGRLGGYVGLANYMGAKFTSSEAALKPVLQEINKRGLLFLDDGSSPRSLVTRLGPGMGAQVGRADLEIDIQPNAEAIDTALVQLEEQAKKNGVAMGIGSALPVTLDRVLRWADSLEERGFILVPISTAVKSNKQS
jgi:polysaccharide deacetylase 2 family uncharacterized protein YibQ